MKEALSVIASAWSVAFISIFVVYALVPQQHDPVVWFSLDALAVTGFGWLIYRHNSKRKDAKNG